MQDYVYKVNNSNIKRGCDGVSLVVINVRFISMVWFESRWMLAITRFELGLTSTKFFI